LVGDASGSSPKDQFAKPGCQRKNAASPPGESVRPYPIRSANRRSASGGIAWSPSATRNHDGSDFQAGTPITSVNATTTEVPTNHVAMVSHPDDVVTLIKSAAAALA
jgi:hypothetical protein